jgi:ketosteroid isomerase-like protein
MHRILRQTSTLILPLILIISAAAQSPDQPELLKARETVWRAWFNGDTKTLEVLVPADTIVMSAGEEKWKHQQEILQTSAKFHAAGGKLLRLDFPRTEVQNYGDVAIVWSDYSLESELGGKRSIDAGRVTEIFVRRNGQWTNPGWHTDSGK